MTILIKALTKRDYENVLQHLSLISGQNKIADWRVNEAKIISFLREGEVASTNRNPIRDRVYITEYDSTYTLSFSKLYASLPDTV